MILTSKSQFQRCLEITHEQQFIARYKQFVLSSVYQPIYDSIENIIGVEALVRIKDSCGALIRPDIFFGSDDYSTIDKINVERLARAIHIRNFAHSKYNLKQLFLNILPIAGEKFAAEDVEDGLLATRIRSLNLRNSQIVMEIIELDCQNSDHLCLAVEKLNSSGFSVAVDDFGVHASTEERVNQVNPQILKLDRSLLLKYCDRDTKPLIDALKLAKRIGALTVIEGIETEEQLKLMRALDIDFYQGFYLAMPEVLAPLSVRETG